METPLTPEQKREYEAIKNNFHKERDGRKIQINNYNSEIKILEGKVSGLEKEVNNLRPKIEGCDNHMICKICDIYSMKFLGSSPNPDKYFFYECVLCGFEGQHT